ncbi:MAG: sulfatase [Planctomycetota bacterium]|nr:sulfatase [Planctomycetota bacterium]
MRHGRWLILLLLMFAAILASSAARAADSPAKKPNIVFLLADDLGWTGLRCFGSDFYETPNLDRLARTGMKFTNAYSACTVCSPTRASVMTGMYPARLHLTDFIAGQDRPWAKLRIPDWTKGLDHSCVTIPEALRDAGYATAQIGKWHLNHPGRDAAADGPQAHGFDVAVDKPRGTKGYRLPAGSNSEGESKSEYLTDYLTDKAVEFIDGSKDKPFFLYFAYHVPHTPIEGREDLVAEFSKKVRADAIHNNPSYAAMVASLDQSVGRVLERLERHKIADNTLVVFTSDNGGLTERYGKHDRFTENLPLRRGKGSAYEGGVRVPTIVRWPGVTPAGSVCDEPVMTIDYYPTLLEITSIKGDAGHNKSVDGKSMTRLLRDPSSKLDRDLFWHYPHYHAGGDSPYSAIRSGSWRLVEFHEDDRVELYNLADDLGEQHDLAATMPDKVTLLRDKLHAWREQVSAQMPTPNPNYDPTRATQVGRGARD